MKYKLQKIKNKTFFLETQISFHECIKHQIFLDTQLQPLCFFDITKLSNS